MDEHACSVRGAKPSRKGELRGKIGSRNANLHDHTCLPDSELDTQIYSSLSTNNYEIHSKSCTELIYSTSSNNDNAVAKDFLVR